jgi:serine phosphatase RsbU (regulator of sigma subunit)
MDLGNNLALYSLVSLRWFWFFSLFHLFFSLRLHFMKLRPKMAVSTLLIAVVPLLLVVIMGILILYSTLGESRAARAGEILKDWAELASQDPAFIQNLSGRSFTWERAGGRTHVEGEEPSWFKEFLSTLEKDGSSSLGWIFSERIRYFWISSEIWLVNLKGDGDSDLSFSGCLLDRTFMDRLARILHSNVRLSFSNPFVISVSGDVSIKTVKSDDKSRSEIRGKYVPDREPESSEGEPSASLWSRPLYFGMTHMDVVSFQSGKFERVKILLLLKASLSEIANELLSERNPLSQAVMIILLVLAGMLLILESFALFFGVRITTGFTSAVRALHRGTRRIAEGDLETQIDIPNEDELGDLAASLNQMAAAVKKGREEALERARLESELETARKIQERLLPDEMPEFLGFEIAGTSLPSQQVGGDYFDFLDIGAGQLGIAIADVSGKGMPAALLMANLQASLHAQVIKPGNVSEVISRINNQLVRSTDPNMFATFFYGILDRSRSTFTAANAGHNPPLLFRDKDTIERLEAGGLVLGFLPDQKYLQQIVRIEPGDIIVLYTDGITEAVGASGEKISENLFGEERLIDVVRSHKKKSAREIQSAILGAISAHTANLPQSDDITLVVIKRGRNKK